MKFKKLLVVMMSFGLMVSMAACGSSKDEDIIGGADEPTSIKLESTVFDKEDKEEETETSEVETEEAETESEVISEDQALEAVRAYCIEAIPDLKDMEGSEDFTTYWQVESSSEEQIVVLFRSYTGAQVRYYINPASGETYVTEFVQGITEEEEETGETFNIKDYISDAE
ncbi:hypothetical protein NXH64_03310 [Butyrivibrio fibrisolvens]|uniref:hypothetical protein n=1 Tax=Pseudobutyrivibrio ruminis TaxID=46206 RepID=UPI00040D0DD0|nr:hypothetical protein [Pseudobutyrivibrio ruminis]MDC7278525.1 hypothetical protein [Butyrivibrio fibrisolvens]